MKIDKTITVLTKLTQTLTKGIPWTVKQPEALIDHINDLYTLFCETLEWDELLTFDNMGYLSVTLTIRIEEEFDIKQIVEGMHKKLKMPKLNKADKIRNTNIVWSHDRYDSLYDQNMDCLQISHRYSHKWIETQSVVNIVRTMISHALSYLEEVEAATTLEGILPPSLD